MRGVPAVLAVPAVIAALGVGALAACGADEDSPLGPVERVIAAARTGDPAGLHDLCDPDGGADSDARRVCAARPERAREWQIFRTWLGDARILGLSGQSGLSGASGASGASGGAAGAPGSESSHDEVGIAVAMGPDQRHVEFTVVRRGGRWYLLRF